MRQLAAMRERLRDLETNLVPPPLRLPLHVFFLASLAES